MLGTPAVQSRDRLSTDQLHIINNNSKTSYRLNSTLHPWDAVKPQLLNHSRSLDVYSELKFLVSEENVFSGAKSCRQGCVCSSAGEPNEATSAAIKAQMSIRTSEGF